LVIAAYERARADALASPDQLKQALAKEAHLSDAVATAVLKRTDLKSASIGDAQRTVILAAGDVLKKSGVVKPEVDIAAVTGSLLDSSFTKTLGQS
jgi:sulfonate transport system substrate-binding protein